MKKSAMPDPVRRFILSVPSVPYLEAILLLRNAPTTSVWDAAVLAQRLYIQSEQVTADILNGLCMAGICTRLPDHPDRYMYAPASAELSGLLAELAIYYDYNLVEVANLIHAQSRNHRVQQFADAFKWRKDK
jgi:hypothetical protein